MELKNGTPHCLAQLVDLDCDGAEHLILVLKASWVWNEAGELTLAPVQAGPRPGDEFHGDPATTSIAAEAELGPVKPSTDVLLTGSAVARRGGTRVMDVRMMVGRIRKTIRVHGDRTWKRGLGGRKPSDAQPFDRIPLIWENAYGGMDDTPSKEKHHRGNPHNPVGRGVRAKGSDLPADGLLPNLEDPESSLGRPGKKGTPLAFAPICRHWLPRREYAGTYDEKWIQERMPLLPPDFDDRFHHAAPADQITGKYLRGGEAVQLHGFGPEGKVEFELPRLSPGVEVRLRSRLETAPMVLDTVGFDTDTRTLRMIYKASVRIHGELPDLRWSSCELSNDGGESG